MGKKPKGVENEEAAQAAEIQVEVTSPKEDEEKEPEPPAAYMLKVVGVEFVIVFFATLAAGCVGIMPLLFYLVFGDLINDLANVTTDPVTGAPIFNFDTIVINMLYIAVGSAAAEFLSSFLQSTSSERVAMKVKKLYFSAVAYQEIAFFDKHESGELLSNIETEVKKVQSAYTTCICKIFQSGAQLVVGLILAFIYSWKMTLVMIASGPVIGIGFGIQGKMVQVFSKKITEANSKATTLFNQMIGSIRTVRAFAGEDKEISRFNDSLKNSSSLGIKSGLAQGVTGGLASFILWGSVALAFWYGGTLVSATLPEDRITIGDMVKVFGMVLFAVIGATQGLGQIAELTKGVASAKALLKTILRTPAINVKGGLTPEAGPDNAQLPDMRELGNIKLENVDFTYPTRKETQVLNGFNLQVRSGTTVALVGASGSGKSTIIGLLERFYDVDAGRITFAGYDIKELDGYWLHKHVAIVTQEPVLFASTLKENILYGKADATDEEVIAAATAANAHNFIMDFPNKYDTVIGERGVSLSGGQKQRIAIARAILKDPKVLLLDEATSALDTESERLVQDALERLMVGRTSIVIAHRLTTIRNADVIVVMQKGKIVESGTHDQLLQNPDGHYRKLAGRQLNLGGNAENQPEESRDTLLIDDTVDDNETLSLLNGQEVEPSGANNINNSSINNNNNNNNDSDSDNYVNNDNNSNNNVDNVDNADNGNENNTNA